MSALEGPGEGSGSRSRNAESGSARWLLIIAVLVLVGIVIAGVIPRRRAEADLKKTTDQLAIPTVEVMLPKKGAPTTEIVLPGNIEAFSDSPIYSRTDGYLTKWYFDIGSHVKKGDLLADIETPEIDQQLDQARADLNTAEANFSLSQITAQRYEDLAKSDSVSKQDVDNANGDFQAKKAMVASAQSNVNRLQQLQSFEKIYAPFDGVITARNTDVGHLINAGASSSPGTELFHIAALNKLRVYINVPQEYSESARPGLTADLELQQFPGREFKGTLVRTADAMDPASRTLLTEVDVENPTGVLLPGEYAQVHLRVPSGPLSVIIPVTALIFRSEGLQAAVVNDGQHAELRRIVLGRDYGSEVEVVSGLTAQDHVMIQPPDSLVQSEVVRVEQETPRSQPQASESSNQQNGAAQSGDQ